MAANGETISYTASTRLFMHDGAEYKPTGTGSISIVEVAGDYDKILFLNETKDVVGSHLIYKWANIRISYGVNSAPASCEWFAPVSIGDDEEKLPINFYLKVEFDDANAGSQFYNYFSRSMAKAHVLTYNCNLL